MQVPICILKNETMARRKALSSASIKKLLGDYDTQVRELESQLHFTNQIISELEKDLKDAKAKEEKSSKGKSGSGRKTTGARRGPGRPRKAPTASAPKRKRGRPKKIRPEASISVKAKPKRGPGRPRKAASAAPTKTAAPKRRGRPPKAKAKAASPARPRRSKARSTSKGYRLSEWDIMIIDALKGSGKAMTSEDLLAVAKKQRIGKNDNERKAKITRSIHKLANKRKEIKKLPKAGRGNAYGI